jgi:hypothetical protein
MRQRLRGPGKLEVMGPRYSGDQFLPIPQGDRPIAQGLNIRHDFIGRGHLGVSCTRRVMRLYEIAAFFEVCAKNCDIVFRKDRHFREIFGVDVIPMPV